MGNVTITTLIEMETNFRSGPTNLNNPISGSRLHRGMIHPDYLENPMHRRSRRNHSPAFRAKVALAAVRGDKTLSEIATQFDVHPTQITQWKAQLLERAASVFEGGVRSAEPPVDLKALHAKIGELALENDFLEGALSKAGLRSARR